MKEIFDSLAPLPYPDIPSAVSAPSAVNPFLASYEVNYES
jgi:hypothetical protein